MVMKSSTGLYLMVIFVSSTSFILLYYSHVGSCIVLPTISCYAKTIAAGKSDTVHQMHILGNQVDIIKTSTTCANQLQTELNIQNQWILRYTDSLHRQLLSQTFSLVLMVGDQHGVHQSRGKGKHIWSQWQLQRSPAAYTSHALEICSQFEHQRSVERGEIALELPAFKANSTCNRPCHTP